MQKAKVKKPKFQWNVYRHIGKEDVLIRPTEDVSARAAVRNVWFTDFYVKRESNEPEEIEQVKAIRLEMFARPILVRKRKEARRKKRRYRQPTLFRL